MTVSRICELATGSPFSGFRRTPEFEITVEERHARDQAWWQMIELSCVTEGMRKDPAMMSQLASAQQSDIQEFYNTGDPKTLTSSGGKAQHSPAGNQQHIHRDVPPQP